MTSDWPDGFLWGTGASSTQCEGAAPASDWYRWEQEGRVPPSGDGNGFATRHAEDFALYAEHGLMHHRLSLEWARLEPEQGRHDPDEVERYRLLLQSARDAGVSIWACLHHFTSIAAPPKGSLKPVSAFSTIRDERARSEALFTEAAKVIQNPRCMNCHPVKRQPTQGDDLHAHVPLMYGGAGDHGVPGLPCKSCHGDANATTLASTIPSVPGHPHWALAPVSMAWQGKSRRDICLQIKDETRNGGRSLSKLHEHMAMDSLVGWAWHPGEGRAPAPGTQAQFGALVEAWISTGAHCPSS